MELLVLEVRVGTGAYAAVWRGRMRGSPVAFIVFHKREGVQNEAELLDRLVAKETAMLKQLRHPSVCSYFGVCRVRGAPAIILEYLAGGSLVDFLELGRSGTPSQGSTSSATSAATGPGAAFAREQKLAAGSKEKLALADLGLARHISKDTALSSDVGPDQARLPPVESRRRRAACQWEGDRAGGEARREKGSPAVHRLVENGSGWARGPRDHPGKRK